MENLLLDENELRVIKKISGVLSINDITFDDFVSESGCDRYDCFFRGTQCACEGICDGRQ